MEELVMAVRRQSQGFSRGTSSYRGVTKHPTERWEARIGIPGSKHIYLGLYSDEKDAAKMYDTALVRLKGRTAATNFALSDYASEMADYHRMQAVSFDISLWYAVPIKIESVDIFTLNRNYWRTMRVTWRFKQTQRYLSVGSSLASKHFLISPWQRRRTVQR